MTKEQFNHGMKKIASIDWRGAAAAAQVILCMRYIESLEAEIAQLQVDNRSLVEQMNDMTMKPNLYDPASLTPDFSNAKVGESCFDVELEHCEISEISEHDVYTMLMVDDGKGNLNPHIIYKDGYAHNPLLFNSFAQFTAYWAEKALVRELTETKGDES